MHFFFFFFFFTILYQIDILQVCSLAELNIFTNIQFNTTFSLIRLHCDIAIAQLSKAMDLVMFKFRDSLVKSTLS